MEGGPLESRTQQPRVTVCVTHVNVQQHMNPHRHVISCQSKTKSPIEVIHRKLERGGFIGAQVEGVLDLELFD
ncbi:unnamed protein product [Sphenostylis stenocarpa]|uniref:Uncharacterized protein n=1 Tax=Sphenostylis stenocarpa TaxID=92480 RepID=A0AA86RYM0_9FABA|nr:unnamed protein product [Sphenostylis stenocarpa]